MGERFSSKQELIVRSKLIQENLKRVLFFSAFLVLSLPIALLVISLSSYPDTFKSTLKTLYLSYEFISFAFLVVSYFALRLKDERIALLTYRIFWAFFLLFSMFVVYLDQLEKLGTTYYCLMIAVLCLIPLLSPFELMYYMVIQAVFILFIGVKFSMSIKTSMDVVLVNILMILFSQYIYKIYRDRWRLKERLKFASSANDTDPLTGLLNRRGLEKEIENTLSYCTRQNRLLTVLMIDVDYFKQYNDDFGIYQGDQCLKQLGTLINRVVLRNTTILSRIDGGKFLVLLHGINDQEPLMLAEKIRSTVEQKRIPNGRSSENPYITISIGAASMPARSLQNFPELYDEAEDALLDAKRLGKNLIVYEEQVYGKSIKQAT